MKKLLATLTLAAVLTPTAANAWWQKGHRLVGQIAADHLTPAARKNVKFLLGNESLGDVAAWADEYRPTATQTGNWHFTDIPADSDVYNRDRDCPVQPGVKLGAPNDKWRDCATDRILFFEQRVVDQTLDPVDRATALKFLVHFVGDIHQPFHASGVERGGNGITVKAFGADTCGGTYKCNLHSIWDGYLIDHRNLSDKAYLSRLEGQIKTDHLTAGSTDPVQWTNESKTLSDAAIVPTDSDIDETYFNRHIPEIDRQLELGGLRLASVLNQVFQSNPVKWKPASTSTKS